MIVQTTNHNWLQKSANTKQPFEENKVLYQQRQNSNYWIPHMPAQAPSCHRPYDHISIQRLRFFCFWPCSSLKFLWEIFLLNALIGHLKSWNQKQHSRYANLIDSEFENTDWSFFLIEGLDFDLKYVPHQIWFPSNTACSMMQFSWLLILFEVTHDLCLGH